MKVALIGNYAPDRQQSMLRYAEMLREGLVEAGVDVRLAAPRPVLNRRDRPAERAGKWIGYADKYLFGDGELRRVASSADVVHVCDHSNAVYVPAHAARRWVVTCHDLLAVRGALGEDTDCPASLAGRLLQRGIRDGLRRADAIACVSEATRRDARRLLDGYRGEITVVPNALHHPYRPLDPKVTRMRLSQIDGLRGAGQYILHVGSGLRRKNREVILRALAARSCGWGGQVVFAGEPLDGAMRELARALGLADRVVEVAGPSNAELEALYNGALALVFPSRFEGFGWPIVEAQACGCPVICSDREPLPEVAGGAAIHCGADDADGFGRAIATLADEPQRRAALARHGLGNAARFERSAMVARFTALYERVLGRA